MRLLFICLFSEGPSSEDHLRNRKAGVTEFRELHENSSLAPGIAGLFCPKIIRDDDDHYR
jgi:hypothetical protein